MEAPKQCESKLTGVMKSAAIFCRGCSVEEDGLAYFPVVLGMGLSCVWKLWVAGQIGIESRMVATMVHCTRDLFRVSLIKYFCYILLMETLQIILDLN